MSSRNVEMPRPSKPRFSALASNMASSKRREMKTAGALAAVMAGGCSRLAAETDSTSSVAKEVEGTETEGSKGGMIVGSKVWVRRVSGSEYRNNYGEDLREELAKRWKSVHECRERKKERREDYGVSPRLSSAVD